MRRIAILITSFNRRQVTLASIASLFSQQGIERSKVSVFLVDDGSTDGTGDAVRVRFPQVRVLQGDGSLYWNGGMRKAFAAALPECFDAYVLFNDDTKLYADALDRLLSCAEWRMGMGKPAIIATSMRCPETGELSYGGLHMRKRGLSMQLETISPSISECLSCDTMNGNLALIPSQVVAAIGILDGEFRHQFGDVDYGLRACQAGFEVILAPGYFGECSDNSRRGTWRDVDIPFAKRWKNLMSPKGAPPKEWLLYTSRHYGWRWPLYAVSPYLKTLMSTLFAQCRGD